MTNTTTHGLPVNHDCRNSCNPDCSGLRNGAQTRSPDQFHFLDPQLVADLRTSLGLSEDCIDLSEFQARMGGRGSGYGGSHCELTWYALGGFFPIA